jgi:hypothetical protein
MSDGDRKLWSAKEWHDFILDAFWSPDTMENGIYVLMGMMEKDDVLVAHAD